MKKSLGQWFKKILFPVFFLMAIVCGLITLGCRSGAYGNFGNGQEIISAGSTGVLSGVVTKGSTTVASLLKAKKSVLQAGITSDTVKIKGADVWVEELPDLLHQTSDENGVFTFNDLPAGIYHAVAQYSDVGKLLKNRSGDMNTVNDSSPVTKPTEIQLLSATNVVSGILRDDTGAPLPEGVELTLWGEKFLTGPGGTFTSPPVPDGTQLAQIKVKAQGGRQGKTFEAPFVSATQPVIIDLSIPKQGATGNPPPTAFITGVKNGVFTNEVFPNETIDLTADSGSFSLDDMKKLTFNWEATLGTLTPKTNPWEHSWKAPQDGELATVTVTVTDSQNRSGKAHFRTGDNVLALAVVSQSWGSNTIEASTTKKISVVFNQKILSTTLSNTTFRVLLGSTPVTGNLAILSDGKTIQFTVSTSFQAGSSYTVVATSGLRGVTGGTLAADQKLTFSTSGSAVNTTYFVTYDSNGSTGGTVPADSGAYLASATVTVLGNTGNLVKAGSTFVGWNTLADGTGTDRAVASTFVISAANVTLYAKWTTNPTYSVTYNGNGSTGGTVPADSGAYQSGTTVTVLGNTGTLVKAGSTFIGWNTLADGTGTDRAAASTFAIGAANVTLYAKWTPAQYTLTYTAGANGLVTGTSTQTIVFGANGTPVTAVATVGFKFVNWSDARTDNPRTDTNVTGNVTVTANFVAMDAKIPGTNKYAWAENSGWIDVAPIHGNISAKLGANGYLSGMAWSENLGWIKFAATSATSPYGNTNATNWGVNLDGTGKLSGYAWCETAGWINFSATNAAVTLDPQTGAMSGPAWAENFGWIKFSGSSYGVQFVM